MNDYLRKKFVYHDSTPANDTTRKNNDISQNIEAPAANTNPQ